MRCSTASTCTSPPGSRSRSSGRPDRVRARSPVCWHGCTTLTVAACCSTATTLVFEETFLFSDTVKENIRFARPDASDPDVKRAAQLAGAAEFIADLPDGYDTVLGERGFSLSGGQRQRVAIARAILADPAVLVLDDATSAVDATKEHEIRAALTTVMEGRTTLVIAHRPATIALADRVAVLEDGRIVEQGTHAELLRGSARYRALLALETVA